MAQALYHVIEFWSGDGVLTRRREEEGVGQTLLFHPLNIHLQIETCDMIVSGVASGPVFKYLQHTRTAATPLHISTEGLVVAVFPRVSSTTPSVQLKEREDRRRLVDPSLGNKTRQHLLTGQSGQRTPGELQNMLRAVPGPPGRVHPTTQYTHNARPEVRHRA